MEIGRSTFAGLGQSETHVLQQHAGHIKICTGRTLLSARDALRRRRIPLASLASELEAEPAIVINSMFRCHPFRGGTVPWGAK